MKMEFEVSQPKRWGAPRHERPSKKALAMRRYRERKKNEENKRG